jgi:uncharacterized protein YcbK (DUF882 family)
MGDLSRNFSRSEFACRDGCGRDYPVPVLVAVLQAMRDAKGRPLRVVSGIRCEQHNARVGGSRRSQHIHGRAADVPAGYASIAEWRVAGAVGIGVRRGKVVHVDVRQGQEPFVFADG